MSKPNTIPSWFYVSLAILFLMIVLLLHLAVPAMLKWPLGAFVLLAVNAILPLIAIRQNTAQMLELGATLFLSWLALCGLLAFPILVAISFLIHGFWTSLHFVLPWGARVPALLLVLISVFDFLYAAWLIRGISVWG